MPLSDLTDVPVVFSNTGPSSGLPDYTQDIGLMHERCESLGFRVSAEETKPDGACGINGLLGKHNKKLLELQCLSVIILFGEFVITFRPGEYSE